MIESNKVEYTKYLYIWEVGSDDDKTLFGSFVTAAPVPEAMMARVSMSVTEDAFEDQYKMNDRFTYIFNLTLQLSHEHKVSM